MARGPPKIYHLLLRTHKLTILLTLPPATTIAQVKEEALSALTSDVKHDDDLPEFTDFKLARAPLKRSAGEYRTLEDEKVMIKDSGLNSWETVYLQLKGTDGEYLPITYSTPALDDEPPEEDVAMDDGTRKAKRKAHPDD